MSRTFARGAAMASALFLSFCASGPASAAHVASLKLFSPEAFWPAGRDAAPAFTPDGKTVFFTHGDPSFQGIMVSHLHKGIWSTPVPASFSGKWRDIEPYMAPDGSYLLFISNRPAEPGGAPLDGYFSGKVQPKAGGNLWRVDRVGDGWGEPVRLPDSVNTNSAIYSPAIAGDGSIYFNQPDPVTRRNRIYRAQAVPGGFEPPVAVSITDNGLTGYDAAVAPDESFIVFSSSRPPAKPGQSLVFISYRRNGSWSDPKPVQPIIEGLEARLSPDMRTLYVSAEPPQKPTDKARVAQPWRIFRTRFHA